MKRLAALWALIALLSACGVTPELQATPSPAPSSLPATPPGGQDEIPVITAPDPLLGIYEDLPVAAAVQGMLPAPVVENPAQIGWERARLDQARVIAEFSGNPRGFAVFYSGCAAVVMDDDQGNSCVYAGYLNEHFAQPLYTAQGEYPRIDTVTGTKFCVYFVEYNAQAWRLLQMDVESGAAPRVVDQGVGRPPRLQSGDGYLTYLAELPEGGYEMRVYNRKWDGDIVTQKVGIVSLPAFMLEPDRSFAMNGMGFTHTETQGEGFVAVAEDLDGIQTAIGFARRPYQAQVGAEGVAWLDGRGAFCAFDPEAERAVSFGEDIDWFAPTDAIGDRAEYLLGGRSGLFAMGRGADGALAALPLAQGDGWNYLAGATEYAEGMWGWFLREHDGLCQIVRVQLVGMAGD